MNSPWNALLVDDEALARRNLELALAEHRSSNPAIVNPLFAPNSQFAVFGSDRHGKPAIYSIAMDKLVSETDGT